MTINGSGQGLIGHLAGKGTRLAHQCGRAVEQASHCGTQYPSQRVVLEIIR